MTDRDRLQIIKAAGLPRHWLDRAAEVDAARASVAESRQVLDRAAGHPAPAAGGDPP